MQTLKPGILVSLKTTLKGNVDYQRTDIADQQDGQTAISTWQTTRVITDIPEHERAVQVRGKASNLIRACCARTSFGLLCPEDRADALSEAISDAGRLVEEFNSRAVHSQIGIYVIRGRVARDDEEAVKAINAETRDLLDAMAQGIDKLDVKAIRDAADRAKQIGQMLDARAQEQVNAAVVAARAAARKIVSRIEKAGEDAAVVLAEINRQPIATARFSFLDVDSIEPEPAPGDAMPAVQVSRFDGLFETEPEPDQAQLEPVQAT